MTAAPGRRALLAGALTFAASRALAQPLPIYGPVGGQSLGGGPLVGSNVPLGASLDLSFLNPGILDPRVTFTRASTATYTDGGGVVRTVAANTPRWDYDLVTHALRGVLIEEARTNQCLYSGDASGATWQASNITVTGNQAIAPDGTTSAASAVYPAVSSGGAFAMNGFGFNATAAVYTGSIYLRGSVGGERLYLCMTPDGVTFYRTAVTLTTSWQRFAVTSGTLTATVWYFEIGTDRRDVSQTSTPAQTIYMWGGQVEAGAFPTSYIPTTAAAVTRAADQCYLPVGAWHNPTALTMFTETFNPTIIGVYAGVSDGTFGNSVYLGSGGIAGGGSVGSGAQHPNAVNKLTGSFTPTQLRQCTNASVVGSAASSGVSLAGATRMSIGMSPWGLDSTVNGHMRHVRYWPRVLSDAEMQQVTT